MVGAMKVEEVAAAIQGRRGSIEWEIGRGRW